MDNSKLSLTAILLLFFMLWAPLGQYEFLVENWMKVGTYAAPILLFSFFSNRSEGKSLEKSLFLTDTKLMSALFLVMYIVHQFEEHWIDTLGEQYAFYAEVNQLLSGLLNLQDGTSAILSPESIYVINTSLVWLVGFLAILRSPGHLFISLAMAGITLINGVSHVVLGISQQAYNPGLVTAAIVFLPLSLAFYRAILNALPSIRAQVLTSIVWAVLAHVIMVVGLLAANWLHLIPEVSYFAILIIWSLIPAFLFSAKTVSE